MLNLTKRNSMPSTFAGRRELAYRTYMSKIYLLQSTRLFFTFSACVFAIKKFSSLSEFTMNILICHLVIDNIIRQRLESLQRRSDRMIIINKHIHIII